ncbi:carboxypeptidase-like regulatory domain-containing protein [Bizionia sediminis]|uniref:Carboxypeptidase-like regulatory domain-containing protein n=1 Tax=Bizionia sediminis TaxID=1737064 RepID=A0ABW5KPY3_9FLAO
MKTRSLLTQLALFVAFYAPISLVKAQVTPQTTLEITGKVVDINTNQPLLFADIVVSGSNVATISNNDGYFTLKLASNLSSETLQISYLGYADAYLPVSEAVTTKTIALTPVATPLDEVTISRPQSAETLVKLMLKNRTTNYVDNALEMTGFYRETIKKRRKNASLSEAVVTIYKEPNSNNKRDAVALLKSRKSTNYARLDTIAMKLQGGPFNNLFIDFMKYPQFMFGNGNIDKYTFEFDKTTVINNQVMYVVNFKQKNTYTTPLYYGTLYIDAKNYALTSARFSLNLTNKEQASALFVKRKPNRVKVHPTTANYRVDYRNSNGKWHYSYSNILLSFKVNWKGRLFNSVYTLNSEMAITNWLETDQKYSKPENKQTILKPNTILIDETSGFMDVDFWGIYNIIEPEKSIETAIEKIRKQLDNS